MGGSGQLPVVGPLLISCRQYQRGTAYCSTKWLDRLERPETPPVLLLGFETG